MEVPEDGLPLSVEEVPQHLPENCPPTPEDDAASGPAFPCFPSQLAIPPAGPASPAPPPSPRLTQEAPPTATQAASSMDPEPEAAPLQPLTDPDLPVAPPPSPAS